MSPKRFEPTTTLNFSGQNNDDIFAQNIRIYDSDTIRISKLENSLNDREFFNAGKNLNPEFLSVFVQGKVLAPGRINIKQNSSLNEAIYMAGGPKGISGPIKFIPLCSKVLQFSCVAIFDHI